MVSRNINSNFYRSVRLKLKWNDRRKLKLFHRGLEMNIYDPVVDGVNLSMVPGYNTKKIDWVDITLTAKSKNPNPLHERTDRDIDEELAMLDEKYRIMQDHLKPNDNNRLLENKQPKDTLIRHGVPVIHPFFSGENDTLIDKMTEKHPIRIPMSTVREQERYFEKRGAFYKKAKLNYVAKLNESTGDKFIETEMGYL